MSPILDLQRRLRELGRIRMGDKGGKGQPQKLNHFRLTSHSYPLLKVASDLWGGEVREWAGSPAEGAYELYTATDKLPIAIPPGGEPISQWYEQWTGGGATHRCDGQRNHITDEPCSCDPENRSCKVTTRLNLMLPDLPDVGVWRLETKGYNAALELPGTIDLIRLAHEAGQYLTGTLRIEHRTSKQNGQTRKFITPCIDLDVTIGALMAGEAAPSSLASGREQVRLPASTSAGVEDADDGPQTSRPDEPVEPESPSTLAPPADVPFPMTEGQRRKLFALGNERGVSRDTIRQIAKFVLGHGLSAATTDEYERMERSIERYAEGGEEAEKKLAAWVTGLGEEAAA